MGVFAIDKNVSKRRTKIDYPFIKAYRVESELVTLGETKGEIDCHEVRIYDRDRTICDVLRNINKMDKEIFNKAVQGYVKDAKKEYTESYGICESFACTKKSQGIDRSVVVMADIAAVCSGKTQK